MEGSQVIDQDLLESAHAAVENRYGSHAPDAREIDYKKLILVTDHAGLQRILQEQKSQHAKHVPPISLDNSSRRHAMGLEEKADTSMVLAQQSSSKNRKHRVPKTLDCGDGR